MIDKNVKKINYSKYYIAFLDILGFKKLVFSKKQSDKKKIEEYFALIEDVTEKLKKIKAKKNIGSIVISDSVILSVPIGDSPIKKINNLRQLCIAVGIIQYKLSMSNIWLRGAISSGDAYFNPSEYAVVGPAYINAYILADSMANFPRVILDNKIIPEIEKTCAQELIDEINQKDDGGLSDQNSSSNTLFDWKDAPQLTGRLKQDVALFIDYLSPLFNNKKEDFDIILKNIQNNIYSDNEVYSKYRWIIDYLLLSCDSLILNHDRVDLKDFYTKLKNY